MIDAHDGYTPTPVISHAILTYNKGRSERPRRRHRDHAVAQSARGRRLQVQSAERRPGRHRHHRRGSSARPTRLLEDELRRRASASRTSARANRPACIATITSRPMSPTSPTSSTWTRSASSGVKIGIDPLGGAGVHYWQPIIERYGLAATIVSDAVDPTFRFMTARLGRQDPHGLLVALRDGAADRHARQVRRRLRQRHRRRPPRHRDPLERADEPEPLPRRRHRLSVRATARTGARTARSARPSSAARSSIASPAKLGRKLVEDAGRLQMVRRRPARRLARLRRRGERRRLLPAARRHGLDDRQGRHHPGPAGRRDHRAHRPRSGRALRRA